MGYLQSDIDSLMGIKSEILVTGAAKEYVYKFGRSGIN